MGHPLLLKDYKNMIEKGNDNLKKGILEQNKVKKRKKINC